MQTCMLLNARPEITELLIQRPRWQRWEHKDPTESQLREGEQTELTAALPNLAGPEKMLRRIYRVPGNNDHCSAK